MFVSKITVVPVKLLLKVAFEISEALSAPIIFTVVALTVELNTAAPAFVVLPTVITSAATVPVNVIIGGAALSVVLLLIILIVAPVALVVMFPAIRISSDPTVPVRSNTIIGDVPV